MAMKEPGVIDIIATDPKSGKFLLVMTEDRPWNDRAMLDAFIAKVETYIGYAISDQFKNAYPLKRTTDIVIKLDCAYPPNDPMKECFAEIRSTLEELGIGFEYEVFPDDPGEDEEEITGKPWWKFW